jgi:hypothetical protein
MTYLAVFGIGWLSGCLSRALVLWLTGPAREHRHDRSPLAAEPNRCGRWRVPPAHPKAVGRARCA